MNPNIWLHPNIVSPIVPVFIVQNDFQFFVAVEKVGQRREILLRKRVNKMTFCDFLKQCCEKKKWFSSTSKMECKRLV